MAASVDVAIAAGDDVVEAVNRLLPLLSASALSITAGQLQAILAAPGTSLLLARERGRIVGMLTLLVGATPTGIRALIEDVAVDTSARGQGIGEQLMKEALRIAAARHARTVDLTSRPSREAANRLYLRVGFEKRDTNVYRYRISAE
jgi:ribosomal protein S18 acetylase RimI-like enzyme